MPDEGLLPFEIRGIAPKVIVTRLTVCCTRSTDSHRLSHSITATGLLESVIVWYTI